jgi:MSHA biogenesis protein MshK
MKRGAVAALSALLAALSVASAHGQVLPDPTRPAIGPGSGSVAVAAPAQLQVVLIGNGTAGRRVAVISGQTLRIGDKFDGAVLVGISHNEAVLRTGTKLKVLRLSSVPEQQGGGLDGSAK